MVDVFETFSGSFVEELSFLPSIWGNSYVSFLPERFAIYNDHIKRFIIYKTSNIAGFYKFEIVNTNRVEPYYLKVINSPTSTPDISYKVPFESGIMILWFANAFLCKKYDDVLVPVIPIMNSSHFDYLCSLIIPSYSGYKIYKNIHSFNYIQHFNKFNEEQKNNIISNAKKIPFDVYIEINTNNISNESIKSIEIKPLPEYVKHLLIENAIKKEECCPITMELINKETATATSCFHVFEKSAIEIWLNLKKNDSKCPVCKQKCAI